MTPDEYYKELDVHTQMRLHQEWEQKVEYENYIDSFFTFLETIDIDYGMGKSSN